MKYIFVGNRPNVLNEMLNLKLDVFKIYCVFGSFLETYLLENNINYEVLKKEDFLSDLLAIDFDVLVSNGCPYIIPVSKIKKKHQLFLNIHPSLLPNLKGKHPINGAILYDQQLGVSCHVMDDGIDTGLIISQIGLPIFEEIDLELIYQIVFEYEAVVFRIAFYNNFNLIYNIEKNNRKLIYYSRKDKDLIIDSNDDLEMIFNKIRAFSISGLYARFYKNKTLYYVTNAKKIENKDLLILFSNRKYDEILYVYGNNVVVYYKKYIFIFSLIKPNIFKKGYHFFGFWNNN